MEIFTSLAKWYGYKTMYNLITENALILTLMVAFIFACLVFFRVLDKQYPLGGHKSVQAWLAKTITIFVICSFVFIAGAAIFIEKKKLQEDARIINPAVSYYIC